MIIEPDPVSQPPFDAIRFPLDALWPDTERDAQAEQEMP